MHTSGGGRWEWRETRDSSPGGEWSGSERRRGAPRLARRASHLDLRRTRSTRRSSFYGSEVQLSAMRPVVEYQLAIK